MVSEHYRDYVFSRLVQVGLTPYYTKEHETFEVLVPKEGATVVDFIKNRVCTERDVVGSVRSWFDTQIAPHIKDSRNGFVYSALQQFLWKRFKPEDINVRLGVNNALVVVTWDYVKYSSESIEPAIRDFCEARGRTYDLDDDRFYVNNTDTTWQ